MGSEPRCTHTHTCARTLVGGDHRRWEMGGDNSGPVLTSEGQPFASEATGGDQAVHSLPGMEGVYTGVAGEGGDACT